MYVSETAKPEQRGRLLLLEGLFGIGGLALAAWLDFGFYFVHNPANWRFPIAFPATFAIIVGSMILMLPESPRWLVKQSKLEEAARVIAKLDDLPVDSEEVKVQVAIIHASLLADQGSGAHSNSIFSFTKHRHFHRTVLAVCLTMMAQMTGANIVPFYSNTILQTSLGYTGIQAREISGSIQIACLMGAGIGCLLIDHVPRRTLLMLSLSVLAISTSCLAGLSSILDNKDADRASVFFYFFALFGFPIGLFLIPFMYAAEIAPLSIRAQVTALAGTSSWLFNFMVVEVTPIAFAQIAWRYYIVYAVVTCCSIVAVFFFYPETKGRSLEEIDEIFLLSKSIFDPVRIAAELPLQSESPEISGTKLENLHIEVIETTNQPV
jgi:Sugar (and other) transporter